MKGEAAHNATAATLFDTRCNKKLNDICQKKVIQKHFQSCLLCWKREIQNASNKQTEPASHPKSLHTTISRQKSTPLSYQV
jgi:hypothetical protein